MSDPCQVGKSADDVDPMDCVFLVEGTKLSLRVSSLIHLLLDHFNGKRGQFVFSCPANPQKCTVSTGHVFFFAFSANPPKQRIGVAAWPRGLVLGSGRSSPMKAGCGSETEDQPIGWQGMFPRGGANIRPCWLELAF